MTIRPGRVAFVLSCFAALAVAAALPALAAPAAAKGWRVSTTVPGGRGKAITLLGVAATSGGNAWATGYSASTGPNPLVDAKSVLLQWNGKSWRPVKLPSRVASRWGRYNPSAGITITASSARNMWEFGMFGSYLRLNGKDWSTGHLKVPAVAAIAFSSKDVWAFGGISTSNGSSAPYSARFDGSKWLPVPVTPANGDYAIYAAAAATPRSIWAIAEPEAEILHWTPARGWRVAPVQPVLPAGTWLDSVAVEPDGTVWLGGVGGSPGDVITYVGELTRGSTAWRTVKLPSSVSSGGAVPSMTGDGHGGVWALVANGLLLHLTGSSVSVVRPDFGKRPSQLNQLALVPGTGSVWGVGQLGRGSGYEGLIALDGPTPR